MKHSPQGARLAQDAERIGVRLARVDDHRQIERARQFELKAEDLLLHLARRKIIVIIEANLAKRTR